MTEDDLTGSGIRKVANRIIATREAMGYSVKAQFAAYCGLTPQQLSNYETATRRPDPDEAGKIAAATNTSTDWIYHGKRANLPHDLMVKIFPAARKAV